MIARDVVDEALRLLCAGEWTHAQIARRLRISRASVARISRGLRVGRLPTVGDAYQPSGAYERCPGCGGLVIMPCVYCRSESYRRLEKEKQRGNHHAGADGDQASDPAGE